MQSEYLARTPWGKTKQGSKCHSVWVAILVAAVCCQAMAVGNRSGYVPYDNQTGAPDFRSIAFDQVHQQIFTAWGHLDRVDVLSASDYHLIRSIPVPSPSSVDISPDSTTVAVGTSSSHILFFDTGTFAKVDDVVFPDSALGITAFVYMANGNAMVRAAEGLSTGGGITAYWDHLTNSFGNMSNAMTFSGPYNTSGPLARSEDYARVLLGDATSGGAVQIVDGNTGDVLQIFGFGGYITGLAASSGANHYAICVEPAGLADLLVILDSSFNEVYQDQSGCRGMAFSADGKTLYRDIAVNSTYYTQRLDMTTFTTQNVQNYATVQSGFYPSQWQVGDDTGMVYGISPTAGEDQAFVAIDTAAGSPPPVPPVNDPVRILRVIDNIGSPQGGDLIRILCTGVDNSNASAVSVKIGGALGTGVSIGYVGLSPDIKYLRIVTVKTPEGSTGTADVTLAAEGKSDTAQKAFQYVRSSKLFPFATSPNFLTYDRFRKRLYAGHKDQVEVIDPIAQQVLAPLVPASGKLASSQFAGISLSPDGGHLYIADAGANLIHVLDLTNPGNGSSIDVTSALGSPSPVSPGRVFETVAGELVGSDANGLAFRIKLQTGKGSWLLDSYGNQVTGLAWTSSNKGGFVLLSAGINGLISSQVALWDATAAQYQSSSNQTQWIEEADANEDSTAIVVGGSTPGIQDEDVENVDVDLNSAGFIRQHFDVSMPAGTPSFFLHPSGALIYKAGTSTVGGSVEVDDLAQAQATASIVFPENFQTSYSPFTDHMLATDDTGRYIFGVTSSGITMVVLDTVPLSVGNVQPAFGQPSGGETVTIRGTGFQPGISASLGGIAAATTFVDENTLTVVAPTLASGYQDVKVTNTNGNSYTSVGAFRVLGIPAVPKITGFSPSPLAISMVQEPQPITVIGSGFESDDTVEIDGVTLDSTFVDASHINATIPWQLTGKTGPVPFTVVSPFTGNSNIKSLSLVNTVPVIHSIWPPTLATGMSTNNFEIYGVDFVAGSVVQWNGQPLATTVVGGMNSAGDELLIASVPASLLGAPGTATVTVFNPQPGGGTSNAVSEDVSPAHPLVTYPTKIDFGTVLINNPAGQTVQLWNLGSATYTVSSATVGSGPFSLQSNTCQNIPFSPQYASSCSLQLQFSPTSAGVFNTTLTVLDNSPTGMRTVPITGTGTQNLVPTVILSSVNSLGQTVEASVYGSATVGGSGIPATAWIEYGTDKTLSSYNTSPTWTFTGDSSLTGTVTGLSPATTYAVRLAVQTAGRTGRSPIKVFATMAASPSVSMSLAPGASNTATVNAGQSAMYQLLVSDGGNGYAGTATLNCTGAPINAKCSVNPSSVQIGVTGTPISVTISTTKASVALGAPRQLLRFWALVLFAGITVIIVPQRGRRTIKLTSMLATLVVLCSCGGGSGSSQGPGPGPGPTPPTPPGTYYVTINASTSGVQNSYLLTLIVQ